MNNIISFENYMKDEKHINYDFVVIGAGIFGSAFATTMARENKKVLLIERDLTEPDRIVGELLQPGGCEALKELGLLDSLEDIDGIEVHGYAVFFHGKPVHIPYTCKNKIKYKGKSFHHGKFVSKLRSLANKEENVTILEATANKLIMDNNINSIVGVQCKVLEEVKNYFGNITIVADGCFSKFRKGMIVMEPETMSHFVGFVLKDCKLPFQYHGHVVLGKTGPILLYQIGTKDTRILVDVAGKLPSNSNGQLEEYMLMKVLPELPESIQPSFKLAIKQQKARVMPNSFLPPSNNDNNPNGFLLVGDAMNMRHPLTGGGMTVAFNDIINLKTLFKNQNNDNLNNIIKQFHWNRKNTSSVINILANALYRLFQSEDDENLFLLQEGCFEYFKLGGECINGPVSFLSGVDGRPYYLVYHFFMVCLYSQYLMIKRSSLLFKPVTAIQSTKLFFTGCRVILPLIYKEFLNLFSVSPVIYLMTPYFFMVIMFAIVQYAIYSAY